LSRISLLREDSLDQIHSQRFVEARITVYARTKNDDKAGEYSHLLELLLWLSLPILVGQGREDILFTDTSI